MVQFLLLPFLYLLLFLLFLLLLLLFLLSATMESFRISTLTPDDEINANNDERATDQAKKFRITEDSASRRGTQNLNLAWIDIAAAGRKHAFIYF